MSAKQITSLHNPRVKEAIKLRDRRQRMRQGRFVIDGAREIGRALSAGVPLTEVFVCSQLLHDAEDERVVDQLTSQPLEVLHVTADVFAKLAFGQRMSGLVAVAKTPSRTLFDLNVPKGTLIAVLEGVEKPGNVGAVLRSADAAGVGAVIVIGGTDLFNPNCIRASLGTIFHQQVAVADVSETIAWLKQRDARVFAATPNAAMSYFDVHLTGDLAIVLGSEAEGVSHAWKAAGATAIRLPMLGIADSLNVSATASVLFYEALRQRS